MYSVYWQENKNKLARQQLSEYTIQIKCVWSTKEVEDFFLSTETNVTH